MKYLFCIFTLILSGVASANSYESLANVVKINADAMVEVYLLNLDEEAALCIEDGLHFELYTEVSKTWLDAINLSRLNQQLLEYEYDDSCTLLSLKMPALYNSNGGQAPVGELEETGPRGNVALLGTNGLTQDSFSANAQYLSDGPAAAFDGYVYKEQVNESSEGKIGRGIWLARKFSNSEGDNDLRLQVDFGKEVTLEGIGIYINAQSLELGRLPRIVTLLTSEDGQEFVEVETFGLQRSQNNAKQFSSSVSARYFRLQFGQNYGDKNFIEVDEVEFYQ